MANDLISRRLAMQLILERTPFKSKHELMQRINSSVADENGWLGGIAESLDEIEDLPAVDAVSVIRCKDCKYNRNPPSAGNALCDLFYGMTDQNGFCHFGERRTDG